MPGLFVDTGVLVTFLPRLALNCDPPNLQLLSNYNQVCELLQPSWRITDFDGMNIF
jgi:hypothetical protein